MQMFSHNAAGFLSFGLGAIVLVLILMGVRHSGVRQRQLRWATDLASQSKKKLMEVQHDQLEASLSVSGGRDALVKRMRARKF